MLSTRITAMLAVLVFLPLISTYTGAQEVSNISVHDAKRLIEKGNVIVLDVRTQNEWKQGTLHGAVLIDVMDKEFKKKAALLEKAKPIVVYCAVGGRSAYAADDLKALGYKNVYNMSGGIQAWIKAGYPIRK